MSTGTKARQAEVLLADFEPDFEFTPPPLLPNEEFEERLRRIRRFAVEAGHDALVVHTDMIGWFHTSNAYLRYICDWMREGVLIIPTDADKELILLSFFTQSVVIPPAGEPALVDQIWQIGAIGREYADRPGSSVAKTAEACAKMLADLGYAGGQIGRIGDRRSDEFFGYFDELLPKAKFVAANGNVDRMMRIASPREVALYRAAAQLVSIGLQAAYHVARPGVTDAEIYAAFTFAQMARGGETGDGYQIGVNEYGTHCGKPYGRHIRRGDLINLYISNVAFRGYNAQVARMIAIGAMTERQEVVLAACTEGVKRAEKKIRPGALVSDVNNAAFESYVERGLLASVDTRTMPYNWSPGPDCGPVRIKGQYVPDHDWEAQGRKLMHVYPAVDGPHNPNLGHSIGLAGAPSSYNVASHNFDRLQEGMVFVLHAQWLEAQSAGCNVGDLYVVTADGFENLSRHTPLDTFRVKAS